MEYLFLILGIIGIIADANSWFIVPNIAIYVCFGLSGIIFIVNFITYYSINRSIKKTVKRW